MVLRARRGGSWRGHLVVVGLLLAGVAGGMLSIWHHLRSGPGPSGGGAAAERHADPATAEALERLEQAVQGAIERGKPAAVRGDVEQFVQRHRHLAGAHRLLGQVLLAEERLPEACAALEASLELEPGDANVHRLAGTVCMKLGRPEDAERHYLLAIAWAPSNAELRLHLAQCHIEQGHVTEARAELAAILDADSSRHDAHGMLADLCLAQGDLAGAMGHINRAIELTPLSERAREALYIRRKATILLRQARPDEARQVLQQGLTELERRDLLVLEQLAECWAMQGQPEEAARQYEAALAGDPTDWRLAAGAARWWRRAGQPEAARRFIRLIRAIDPRLPVLAELDPEPAAAGR